MQSLQTKRCFDNHYVLLPLLYYPLNVNDFTKGYSAAQRKHHPLAGCGEVTFASRLPESAWHRCWHARQRGRVDAILGGVLLHNNVIFA